MKNIGKFQNNLYSFLSYAGKKAYLYYIRFDFVSKGSDLSGDREDCWIYSHTGDSLHQVATWKLAYVKTLARVSENCGTFKDGYSEKLWWNWNEIMENCRTGYELKLEFRLFLMKDQLKMELWIIKNTVRGIGNF